MKPRPVSKFRLFLHRLLVGSGGAGLTLGCFLVLPLLQRLGEKGPNDLVQLHSADTVLPPPPPVMEEIEEEEPEPEEEPPELEPEDQLIDLSALEMALEPGFGSGGFGGFEELDLSSLIASAGGGGDGILSANDLDQKPRVLYRASPSWTAAMRRKAPGSVVVLFVVDERGRVTNPTIRSSTDPVFEAAAIKAVKQWKYEPARSKGKPTSFRISQPLTFPKK